MNRKDLCDYGCGREAQYEFKNGKKCCASSANSCIEQKKKNTGNKAKGRPQLFGVKRTAWNKGLTKENNEIVKAISAAVSKTNKGKQPRPNQGRGKTEEKEFLRRERISQAMKANPNSGGLREGSGRGKKGWYESPIAGRVYLRSTYELEYAKFLDANNIQWKGNTEFFEYLWEGKTRKYYPDMYLIDTNQYVEIKGFATEKDKEKWKAVPNLKILFFKDLKNLGLQIK